MRGKVDGLEAMSILLTVVETGSRSAAGRRPGTPLAVASRKVCDLAARVGALSHSGLDTTRVGTVRLAGRGSPAYFAARGMPRRPAELGAHDCVTIEILAVAWRFSAGKSDV